VQFVNEEEQRYVRELLEREELMSGWCDMERYANYKYFIQIGGNGVSWGVMKKLRLGCCMISVNGRGGNWHERYLRPWEHYVPVAADLSDLTKRVQWCFDNQGRARQIAENGRSLALSINYEAELREAADLIWKTFGNR
jgi:hypothetical protein